MLWELLPLLLLTLRTHAQGLPDPVPRSPVVLIRQPGPAEQGPLSLQPQGHFGFNPIENPFNAPLYLPPQLGQVGPQPQPIHFYPQAQPPPQPLFVPPIFGPSQVVAPPPPATVGCQNPIPVRPPDSIRCKWYPVYDALGCVVDYECGEPDCPNSPVRPTSSTNCEWVEIKDKNDCTTDWECEPLNAAGCPGAPPKPDAAGRCKWNPVKNDLGCVNNWFCHPILPGRPPLPGSYGRFGPPPPREGDEHPFCCHWAAIGDCVRNPLFMKTQCRKSCGTPYCSVEDVDSCKVLLDLEGCKLPRRPPPGLFNPLLPFPPRGPPPPPFGPLNPLGRPLKPFLPPPNLGPFGAPLGLGGTFGGPLSLPLNGFNGFPSLGPFGGPFGNPLGNPFSNKPIPLNGLFGPTFPDSNPFGPLSILGLKPPLPRFGGPLGGPAFGGPLNRPLPNPFGAPFGSPLGGPPPPPPPRGFLGGPFPFGIPTRCVNKSPGCQIWSLLGHCRTRAAFMLKTCGKSCGACGFLKKKKKK